MIKIIGKSLHQLTGVICVALFSVLLLSEVLIVLLRYTFNSEFSILTLTAMYTLSALAVLAIPYALAREAHNRVDLLNQEGAKDKTDFAFMTKTVNILATALLLFPIIGIILYIVLPDISYSWEFFEKSENLKDITGLSLIKTFLPVSGILMMIQGASILMRDKQ